jgi:hypothetical protein
MGSFCLEILAWNRRRIKEELKVMELSFIEVQGND